MIVKDQRDKGLEGGLGASDVASQKCTRKTKLPCLKGSGTPCHHLRQACNGLRVDDHVRQACSGLSVDDHRVALASFGTFDKPSNVGPKQNNEKELVLKVALTPPFYNRNHLGQREASNDKTVMLRPTWRRLLSLKFLGVLLGFSILISVIVAIFCKISDLVEVMEEPGHNWHPIKPNHNRMLDKIEDIFITVRTTRRFHRSRVPILLDTWVGLIPDQVWFVTDSPDPELEAMLGTDKLVVTDCSQQRSRTALVCKMWHEFDLFMNSDGGHRWWCHFDDDTYVHVTRLLELLAQHSSFHHVYLGKPSTAEPLQLFDPMDPLKNLTSPFWFATGGAGFCISRALASAMAPYVQGGKLLEVGQDFWLPDDVTLGYIIEYLLHEKLTVVPEFHSHLEPMGALRIEDLDHQVSLSSGPGNVLGLKGPYPPEADPSRFYSLHCHLYGAAHCPRGSHWQAQGRGGTPGQRDPWDTRKKSLI